MQTVTKQEDLLAISDNTFVGTPPVMNGSRIEFRGTGNILYCEDGVKLSGGTVRFNGDNGLVVLRKSRYSYSLDLTVYNSGFFYSGNENYFNGTLHAICSEGKFIILGNDCLFSFGIWIRTADPHLVYDVRTKERLNYSKDVLVGDHVWLGQDSMLLKGAVIGSGSIIGARAVVSGRIFSNSSWGGIPARCIREGVFWDRPSVHNYTEEDTERSRRFSGDPYCFSSDSETLGIPRFLSSLHDLRTAEERLDNVRKLLFEPHTNRFFIAKESSQTKRGNFFNLLHH